MPASDGDETIENYIVGTISKMSMPLGVLEEGYLKAVSHAMTPSLGCFGNLLAKCTFRIHITSSHERIVLLMREGYF